MELNLVPTLDADGLPGPAWLFHLLLVFTFFLHMLFMNLTLGGTFLAWISHLRSGKRSDDPNAVLAGRMTAINGFAISLTITTGVAPLLFVQIIYQQFFYTGTILMGWIWFSFLGLMILGYYATYVYKFKGTPRGGSGRGFWLGLSAITFLLIAMVHVGVHLIHVQPDRWAQYAANPWSVLGDPTYWPRLLHFVLASVGFAALVIAWWAARRAAAGAEVDVNTAIAKTGWRWALWTVVLQMVDGFILLGLMPGDVLSGLMGGGIATLAPLTLSILLGIGLLVMLARPIDPIAKRGLITGTLASMVLTVAIMSITRHQVRALYLEPVTSSYSASVVPQWVNFVLFAVLLVAAVVTVAYMTRRVLSEPASGDEAA
jgi:cytochrome bd-type quinol oxidase subunit 1